MTNIVDAFNYFIRVFSNIDVGSGSVIGIFHLTAFTGVFSMFFLLVLAALVLRAEQTAKNRFMTLMLVTEALSAGFLTLYWLYPWSLNALPFLYPFRLLLDFLGMQRAVLFLSAPFFYVDKPFAKRITSLYGSWGGFYLRGLEMLDDGSSILICEYCEEYSTECEDCGVLYDKSKSNHSLVCDKCVADCINCGSPLGWDCFFCEEPMNRIELKFGFGERGRKHGRCSLF